MAGTQTTPARPGVTLSNKVQFGVFEADLKTEELRRSGVRVRIQSQPFKLLAALLERPGTVVTKEELHDRLWGENTTIDYDHGLGIAINKLREALGDSAENPRFIETLSRRGYRFLAPVRTVPVDADPSSPGEMAAVHPAEQPDPAGAPSSAEVRRLRVLSTSTAALAVVLAALTIAVFLLRPVNRKPYHETQVTFNGRVMNNNFDVQDISVTAADSSRLYFINMDNGMPSLVQALIANGEMTRLPLPAAIAAPSILSISPDGSALLVRNRLLPEAEESIWIVETLGGDAQRVPNLRAHDATWMPDGKHLLIAQGRLLQVVGVDGSDLHTVATLPGPAFWLRWSPDGSTLRYSVRDLDSRTTSLWEISAKFQNAHPLFPGWSSPPSECCGSWTSDGADFVFQSQHSGHSEIWKIREKPWFRTDREPQQVTSGPIDSQTPVAATQGHRIFFVGANPRIELLKAQAKGSGFEFLGHDLWTAAFVKFSADGTQVAWLNAADGSLWRSRADGSERVELIAPPIRVFNMDWSPNDKQLAVMAEMPGKPWKIYRIDADGGQPQPLLDENRNEADPTWSSDGKSIVFGRLSERLESDPEPKAIYEVEVATRKMRQLPASEGLFSPRNSPDGRYVLGIRQDQRALLLFDRQTQTWRTLTTHGVGDPSWARDSKSIVFQDFIETGKPIYKIEISTGILTRLFAADSLRTIPATDFRLISLTPDNLPVVSAWTSTVNIYSIDLD